MREKSPFPGMDPWLERHWQDVHSSLIIYARDALQERLPGPLRARVEERVFIEATGGLGRGIYPDVMVVERRPRNALPGGGGSAAPGASAAIAESLLIRVSDEPTTERFIEIVDAASGARVVSVIEVLSLSNKFPGVGRALYQKKQQDLADGKVNLVEIDLLRDGERVTDIPLWKIPTSHRTPYRVVVHRVKRPLEVELYRVPLRERLPVIGVPLRESDPDAPLDLQELIERCYRNGRYGSTLDYSQAPEPPLGPEDAAWAAGLSSV